MEWLNHFPMGRIVGSTLIITHAQAGSMQICFQHGLCESSRGSIALDELLISPTIWVTVDFQYVG